MKKLLSILTISLLAFSCGRGPSNTAQAEEQHQKDRLEILYFHGKQRCATCMAIEKNTKEAVESQFAEEIRNGSVVLRIIDLSEPENEAVAEKYGVTWSSLFISRWKAGKETYEDLTKYAFANARTAPDTFKAELVRKIAELQK